MRTTIALFLFWLFATNAIAQELSIAAKCGCSEKRVQAAWKNDLHSINETRGHILQVRCRGQSHFFQIINLASRNGMLLRHNKGIPSGATYYSGDNSFFIVNLPGGGGLKFSFRTRTWIPFGNPLRTGESVGEGMH